MDNNTYIVISAIKSNSGTLEKTISKIIANISSRKKRAAYGQ